MQQNFVCGGGASNSLCAAILPPHSVSNIADKRHQIAAPMAHRAMSVMARCCFDGCERREMTWRR